MIAWTIFDRPADYPDCFVARKFLLNRGPDPVPTQEVITAHDLDELRGHFLGLGLACFVRDASDEPRIVETWL